MLAVTIHWKAKNNRFRFSLSLFTFFTFTFAFEKWFFHFFHFHFRFLKVIFSLFSLSLSLLKSEKITFFTFTFAFEKWKNHFSTFPQKVLKCKKWKAKVKIESDYFSRSNVCLLQIHESYYKHINWKWIKKFFEIFEKILKNSQIQVESYNRRWQKKI